jgi:hypothetical protein
VPCTTELCLHDASFAPEAVRSRVDRMSSFSSLSSRGAVSLQPKVAYLEKELGCVAKYPTH